jgi:hypothetical protein
MRPVQQPRHLAGQVRVHVLHEASELVGVVDRQQEMRVVRQKDHAMAADSEPSLSTAEDAADDLIEGRVWAQEEA